MNVNRDNPESEPTRSTSPGQLTGLQLNNMGATGGMANEGETGPATERQQSAAIVNLLDIGCY